MTIRDTVPKTSWATSSADVVARRERRRHDDLELRAARLVLLDRHVRRTVSVPFDRFEEGRIRSARPVCAPALARSQNGPMPIGVGLDPSLGLSWDEQRETVREAVRLGYTSAWAPSWPGGHDAFLTCERWSAGTRDLVEGGIETGILVVPAPLWTPMSLATIAATAGEQSGGRFVLGVGTGGTIHPAFRRTYGIPDAAPIAQMRDQLVALRGLLAGETVSREATLVLRGARLAFRPPPVPVYLGALGPRMLRLAGEAADGVALNWCGPDETAWSRRRVVEGARAAGRDPAAVRVVEYVRVAIDDDVDLARRALARSSLPYVLARQGEVGNVGYRRHFARMGFEEELNELAVRRERGASTDELAERVPVELLRRVGYFGPAAGAADAFRRLSDGLDLPILRIVAVRGGLAPALATIRALAPSA